MAVAMPALLRDLAAETDTVRSLVAGLDEPGWHTPTPSPGWSIADQVSHLAFFDDQARLAATDPGAFTAGKARFDAKGGIDPDRIVERYRSCSGRELLSWFTLSRGELISAFAGADPKARVPWFGPSMSISSSATARLMETWAHGVDIADALGAPVAATDRLRHVAHIGVGARDFSIAVHGQDAPTTPIHVELAAPDGSSWIWGPPDATDRIRGDALEFCLAVTQRRHLDDLALSISGPLAAAWMAVAQAFAGEAGQGRQPFSPTVHMR